MWIKHPTHWVCAKEFASVGHYAKRKEGTYLYLQSLIKPRDLLFGKIDLIKW